MNCPNGHIALAAVIPYKFLPKTNDRDYVDMRPVIALVIVIIMIVSGLTAIGLLLYQMGMFD